MVPKPHPTGPPLTKSLLPCLRQNNTIPDRASSEDRDISSAGTWGASAFLGRGGVLLAEGAHYTPNP